MADALAVEMQAAALHGDTKRAIDLLAQIEEMPESLAAMKWASEHSLASLYERQGNLDQAPRVFQRALLTFENARDQIRKPSSQLPFVANATAIYDDYIHFLITQHKPEEALLTADQSRARTLAQGLGFDLNKPFRPSAALHPQAIAQKANATLLFYWLGKQQSYIWAVTPQRTTLFTLPSRMRIAPLVERYRKTLLGPADPLQANDETGESLYNMLIAPAASLLPASGNVMILADGPLSLLNFETLLVPANQVTSNPARHYWIEDVNVISAPSLAMLDAAKPSSRSEGKLLLLGDAISPDPSYPELPLASLEMKQIEKHFPQSSQTVFARQQANPSTYLTSTPKQFSYIHFVAHGVASRTDPLDSAIILSRTNTGEDSFKLYARDIMRHSIDARLVTISACYGSGTRFYFGEGLVGLSWAFLRAGAHNTIGALWEASDDSTPRLMDGLYQGIERGQSPSAALRQAKLELLQSRSIFRKPFYWAPFQIYTRL
jgi:CHAT domain-containing protein